MLQTTEIEMQFLFAETFRAAVDQAAVCLPPPPKKNLNRRPDVNKAWSWWIQGRINRVGLIEKTPALSAPHLSCLI